MSYENTKKWREKNRDKQRAYNNKYSFKRKYGITHDDYDLMYTDQKGKCLICERHQSDLKQRLCLDHNHATGEIRGLLCHQCNHGIGLFYENVNSLKRAITYLGGVH